MTEAKSATTRYLIFGAGERLCQECRVALVGRDDNFCSACGAPMNGLRSLTFERATAIGLARQQAAREGVLPQ